MFGKDFKIFTTALWAGQPDREDDQDAGGNRKMAV
jgi:hypothetical protein